MVRLSVRALVNLHRRCAGFEQLIDLLQHPGPAAGPRLGASSPDLDVQVNAILGDLRFGKGQEGDLRTQAVGVGDRRDLVPFGFRDVESFEPLAPTREAGRWWGRRVSE